MALLSALFVLQAGTLQSAADTYTVTRIPEAAVPLNGSVVAAAAHISRAFEPQRVSLQLALLGPPAFVPAKRQPGLIEPGLEDCGAPLVPMPIPAVTTRDLSAARHVLEQLGFVPDAITTALVDIPAVSFCGPSSPARIGQILIAIRPYDENVRTAVKKINVALQGIPNLRPAGIIVAREDCDAERLTLRTAQNQVMQRAAMLAHLVGMALGPLQTSDTVFDPPFDPWRFQTLCGHGARPTISAFASSILEEQAPPYDLGMVHAAIFAILPGYPSAQLDRRRVTESVAFPGYSRGIAYRLHIARTIPFVSAQGFNRVLIRPDALLATFWAPNAPARSVALSAMRAVMRTLRDSKIPSADIRIHSNGSPRVIVRITLRDVPLLAAIRARSRENAVDYAFTPFVHDCDAMEHVVAARALANAVERGHIMTAAAGLSMGPILAIDDAGHNLDAVCGFGPQSSTDALDNAASRDNGPHLTGTQAEFESDVAVAWRLEGGAPLASAAAPSLVGARLTQTNINLAFSSSGASVLGSATIPVAPTDAYLTIDAGKTGLEHTIKLRSAEPRSAMREVERLRARGVAVDNVRFADRNCKSDDLRALAQATINGLKLLPVGSIHSLVDQGTQFEPEAGLCGLSTEHGLYIGGAYAIDKAHYSMEHRVVIIGGTNPGGTSR